MGTQTGADLMYGVPLPEYKGPDGWEQMLFDLEEQGMPLISIAVVGVSSLSGGTDYLTALHYEADLGEPSTVSLGTVGADAYDGMHGRLLRIWRSLGLPVLEMPEPGWILAASSS